MNAFNPTALDDSKTLAFDAQAVGRLRYAANQHAPEALKASAKQFEALFINMMLKSMRQATAGSGTDTSQDAQMYTSMLDQQLSQVMAQRGIGLADMMLQQLQHSQTLASQTPGLPAAQAGLLAGAVPLSPPLPSPNAIGEEKTTPRRSSEDHVEAFRQSVQSHAEQVSRVTGVPSAFIVGQAALESGWGKRQIRGDNGQLTHNLFGIKASADWKGDVAEVTTTEYVDGQAYKKVAKFKAYASYEHAFQDYADLLTKNPRYQGVLQQGQSLDGFAQNLQKAGYATDPMYADKLSRLVRRYLIG